jgi:hypothetical protein
METLTSCLLMFLRRFRNVAVPPLVADVTSRHMTHICYRAVASGSRTRRTAVFCFSTTGVVCHVTQYKCT